MTRLSDWALPGRIWAILLSWGLAVFLLVGLLAWRIWENDRQQDRDMCAMISVFLAGPAPVNGPAGERGRVVQEAMNRYYGKRDCGG